jgi:DNA polymerase-3 subunit epsilon
MGQTWEEYVHRYRNLDRQAREAEWGRLTDEQRSVLVEHYQIIPPSSGPSYLPLGYYKGKHYTQYAGEVKDLKRKGQLSQARELLYSLINAVEEEAREDKWMPAPWYYEQAAIVCRKQKDCRAEVEILERYVKNPFSPLRSKLHDRLVKACNLAKLELDKNLLRARMAILDTETTGFSGDDELIEIALLLVSFDRESGQVLKVEEEYQGLREPSVPSDKRAKKVHGIEDHELVGKSLDYSYIKSILDKADLIVAHNASFDRRFVTKIVPEASEKSWYCSMNGIKWRSKGFSSTKLAELLDEHSISVDTRHRAMADAWATMKLLSIPDRETGKPYLDELLSYGPVRSSRQETPRNWIHRIRNDDQP